MASPPPARVGGLDRFLIDSSLQGKPTITSKFIRAQQAAHDIVACCCAAQLVGFILSAISSRDARTDMHGERWSREPAMQIGCSGNYSTVQTDGCAPAF